MLATRVVAAMAAAALFAAGASSAQEPAVERDPLAAARALLGVDHARARLMLGELRTRAVDAAQLETRAAIDELECRLLSDEDSEAARDVAARGIAATRALPSDSLALLRLRACHAGVVSDLGDPQSGAAELEAVMAASITPQLRPALALARLERGLRLSRKGEFVAAQVDLLWSCQQFAELRLADDEALCLSHLAGHHKRIGEFDDALRILSGLLESARRRGASIDQSIYLYSTATVHATRSEWPLALQFFRDALALETRRGDTMGMSYSKQGVANALMGLGRLNEALSEVEGSLALLDAQRDPSHTLRSQLLKAEILVRLNRATEAESLLAKLQAVVQASGDDLLGQSWLIAQAAVHASLGNWRAAYEAQRELGRKEAELYAKRLSRQSANLRQQFHRERDEAAIRALEASSAQERKLRQVQWVAIGLFGLLLSASLAFGVRKLSEARRLRIQALSDELTKLPNRRAILAHAEELLSSARRRDLPLSVLMIDADHFKKINDHHGHASGDQVLRELARRLSTTLRGDDRLGRIGGEEFLVVLPDADTARARAIAERMRQVVASEPFVTDAGVVPVTVSIGLAARESTTHRVVEIMSRADAALYRAKEMGRNVVAEADASVPADGRTALRERAPRGDA